MCGPCFWMWLWARPAGMPLRLGVLPDRGNLDKGGEVHLVRQPGCSYAVANWCELVCPCPN